MAVIKDKTYFTSIKAIISKDISRINKGRVIYLTVVNLVSIGFVSDLYTRKCNL